MDNQEDLLPPGILDRDVGELSRSLGMMDTGTRQQRQVPTGGAEGIQPEAQDQAARCQRVQEELLILNRAGRQQRERRASNIPLAGSYSGEDPRIGLRMEYREKAVLSTTADGQGEAAAPAEPMGSSRCSSSKRVHIQKRPTRNKELELKVRGMKDSFQVLSK